MAGKFQLKKASNGQQYMFNLKASNGETILTSELYDSKQGAQNGIVSVRENSPYDSQYKRKISVRNEPYFVLVARNNEIIGTSEMYSTENARDNGIASVKINAPSATVEDLT
jgi:uncharacterized protein YegP (UPF0339 family)